MIPDSTLIAACTVPDSLNSKKSARGVVEKRIDPETVIIKTGSEKITVKVPEEKLQAGDTVVMKFQKGYVLLEKVQMPRQHPPGTPDSFSSAKITYSDQHLSAALDSAIGQLKSGEKDQFVSQRIISVLNALESNASGEERDAIQKASATLEKFDKSPAEVKNRSQELINLLESVKKEIAQRTPVRELEKLIFIDIPDKQIPEGVYKISSKEELASFLQAKADGDPDSLSPAQQNKEFYIRTFPSGSGTTAILLDKGSLTGEIQSWSRGFSSSIMQSVPAQVYEQLLESRESIELATLHRIDAVLQSARHSLPQTRAGSQSAQAASLAQWLNTALENTEILAEVSARPPVNASTVAVQLEEINAAVVKDALPSLTPPEQFGVTEDNLDKNINRAEFLTKLMQKAGIDFENSISENSFSSIKEPNLKYSLLSLMNAVDVPAKNGEEIRSDIKELQKKIDSIRASISTHLQAAADESPEIQTERVAVILAKAVYIAQMLQTSTENPQAAPGETAKDSRFATTLSFLLKEISNSLEKKTLPEFTNLEQAKATGSRSDFLAKLLAFLGIDVDRKNAGEGTAQDAPSPDFSERAHPLPGFESFRPAEISQETPRQAAPSRSFTETQFDSNEQIQTNRAIKGDPETFTDRDLKDIQNRLDSLRRSVEALRETQTEDFEAQTEKKGAVVAKVISAAQWFTDSEIADQLQSDKSRSATVVPVLNVMLKEISKSLQTESLPEFTNPQSFRVAVETVDKNRLDLLAMILEKSKTDSHFKPGTFFSSQKQIVELADTLLSFLTSGRSGAPSGSSSEISASEQPYYKSSVTLSTDSIPPEDIDELQVKIESLKKSVQEFLQSPESQDADVKQKLKSEIVEKTVLLAKWFTSTDKPRHLEGNRPRTESTASVLNTLLKETISSIDKKVIPEFVTDRSVKAASESPDIKTRMDLLFRLLEKSGSGKEGVIAASAPKQAVLDLTDTIVSFLNSGKNLPVQEKTVGNTPTVTTQRTPEGVNRISRGELKEIYSTIEDLRRSLQALIEADDTDTPEIITSAKADLLGKVLSVARAINESADKVFPDNTSKLDVSTRSVFSSLLREIVPALDKKAFPEFTSPEFISTASEVSDEKIRDDFPAKFLQKIGITADQKNPAASGTVKTQSSSDLPELLLSILSERKDILPQQRDPGSTKQVSADAFKDETIRAQRQFSLHEKRVPQSEIKELQKRIESLRKSIESLMQVQDSKNPEVSLSKGTDVLQKAVSVAQWFNESSYEKQVKTDVPVKNTQSASALSSILPNDADKVDVSPRTVFSSLLREIISALGNKSFPEFTSPEFITTESEVPDDQAGNNFLAKLLQKIGITADQKNPAASGTVKPQSSSDLSELLLSILSERKVILPQHRDPGSAKQVSADEFKNETIHAQRQFSLPEKKVPQSEIKELQTRIESLRKSIESLMQIQESKSPEVRLSKGTDVLRKAVSVAQWFDEPSNDKQVKTDTPVKNSPSASALSSILNEIKVSLEKNTLSEFTKSEFIRTLHKNEYTASRADLLTKFMEKTGNPLETASDITQAGEKRSPDLTAAVISILSQQKLERDISTPESAITENPDTQPDQVAIEKELKAKLESLKKEIDLQLKALENQSRQKPKGNFSDISRTLPTLPEKLEKLLSTFTPQSPQTSLSGNLSQAIIEELLTEKSVSGFSNLALKSLVIPEDSTLSDKIKNLAFTALGSQTNPGIQSIQELLDFLHGNLKPQFSVLSGLLSEVEKSASGIKPNLSLFSFIKKETSETLQTYLTKVFNWFAEKSSNVLRSDFSGTAQFPAERKIFDGSTTAETGPAPTFPFDKAGLIKTAADILGILQSLEENLTKSPFSSPTQLKDTHSDQNLFTGQKIAINERQTRAELRTAENISRVIGQSVMKALSEIKDLIDSTLSEAADSEKSSNQASGSAEKKTGPAGDGPLQKFLIKSRSELANRTENILNRVSGELENTLKRVNETFEIFSRTAQKGQSGAATQIPVLIEKAIDEIIKNLRDLKDSLQDSSSSPLSKEISKAELLRKSDSPSDILPERDLLGETESFSSKAQIRQSVESLLNRLESLQLLARQTQTPAGDQQIIALPMKIGGEWTEVNVRFVKKNQGRDKKGNQNHFSVYLNVSPSQLGAISIQMEYERKKSLYLDVEFEKKETRTWFSKNSDDLRRSLAKLDLPMAQMVIHQVRAGQKNEPVQETDGTIDMKV